MTIKHKFNNAKADGADATLTRPSNWNDDHDVTDITIQGLARRIWGDFSNATISNRVIFQTNTVNGGTSIAAIPDGSGGFAQWQAYDSSDTLNAVRSSFIAIAGETRIANDKFGTASYGPITFYTAGSERMRLDASGNLVLGVQTAQRVQADFENATRANRTLLQTKTANSATNVGAIPNGTNTTCVFTAFGTSDPDNGAFVTFGLVAGVPMINSTAVGTGVQQPLNLQIASTTRAGLDTSGNFIPGADNTYTLGKSGARWSVVWAATGTISTSDARAKRNIAGSALGLAFINALRPVSYQFVVGGNIMDAKVVGVDAEGEPVYERNLIPQPGKRTHWGLIASEVKAAADSAGVDFAGYVKADPNDADSEEGLRYEQLVAPLIKAVQELSARVVALELRGR
jgi:hypothetical protein